MFTVEISIVAVYAAFIIHVHILHEYCVIYVVSAGRKKFARRRKIRYGMKKGYDFRS